MSNPKDAAARAETRVRLDLLEHVANVDIARVMEFGAITKKYGIQNYRTTPIDVRTYIAAIERHIGAYKDGEDIAPDSGLSHLAHIGANVHVMLGAQDACTLNDDRGPGEPRP